MQGSAGVEAPPGPFVLALNTPRMLTAARRLIEAGMGIRSVAKTVGLGNGTSLSRPRVSKIPGRLVGPQGAWRPRGRISAQLRSLSPCRIYACHGDPIAACSDIAEVIPAAS